jgi:hypothetical protein
MEFTGYADNHFVKFPLHNILFLLYCFSYYNLLFILLNTTILIEKSQSYYLYVEVLLA